MLSADWHDTAVKEVFGDVLSVGSHDAAVDGLLKEMHSTQSMPRYYKQDSCCSSLLVKSRVEFCLRVGKSFSCCS